MKSLAERVRSLGGLKYAFVFAVLGSACAFYCASVETALLRLLFGSLALCWWGVSLAYVGLGAKVFGERSDGRLKLWSVLFWPCHLLNALTLYLFWRRAKENPFDVVTERVLLGCQLSPQDAHKLQRHDVRSVLDVTCEFSETPFLRAFNYRSIPVLDTFAPTPEELCEGVRFIEESAKSGSVYVHCALGHGRSALFVAAYLLESGRARNAGEAFELVKEKRAKIEFSPAQRRLLQQFAASKPHFS